MLETSDSLLIGLSGFSNSNHPLPVIYVGFEEESLNELKRLLETLGVLPQKKILVHLKKISPATYIGAGKIEEIQSEIEAIQAKAVILDVELSPNQLRNLEKILKLPVLDRPGVIIEIFSQNARTKESKTQVALARLQYLLPRLTHFWSHFERQRGGGPSSRGMGETQIEVDRRLIKDRISVLKSRLKSVEKERAVQRSGRKNVLKVAFVGYTNAGKSTLLNALTHSQVLAEDKLFATLDASVRTLDPHSHPPIVAIDTVGFINHLPPSLVASFRSTLEELKEADLLVHVVDGSHPNAKEQLMVTEKILEELEVHLTPRLTVLNKVDLAKESRNQLRIISPGALAISALQADDVIKLRDAILHHFQNLLEIWEVMIPYSESKLEAQIHAYGCIIKKKHLEKGTFYQIKIEPNWAKKLNLGKYKI